MADFVEKGEEGGDSVRMPPCPVHRRQPALVCADGMARWHAVRSGRLWKGDRVQRAHAGCHALTEPAARPHPGVQLTAGGSTCCLASTTFLRLQLTLVESLCPCFLAGFGHAMLTTCAAALRPPSPPLPACTASPLPRWTPSRTTTCTATTWRAWWAWASPTSSPPRVGGTAQHSASQRSVAGVARITRRNPGVRWGQAARRATGTPTAPAWCFPTCAAPWAVAGVSGRRGRTAGESPAAVWSLGYCAVLLGGSRAKQIPQADCRQSSWQRGPFPPASSPPSCRRASLAPHGSFPAPQPPAGLEAKEFYRAEGLANHMGLFLQKTNIIRDYLVRASVGGGGEEEGRGRMDGQAGRRRAR